MWLVRFPSCPCCKPKVNHPTLIVINTYKSHLQVESAAKSQNVLLQCQRDGVWVLEMGAFQDALRKGMPYEPILWDEARDRAEIPL